MTDKELIEFFRAWARDIRKQHSSSADARTIDYAADRLEALPAENKKMREALKSFIGGSTETFHGETSGAKGGTSLLVTWDEIRAARAALKGGE